MQSSPQFSETSLVHITAVYVSMMKKLPSKNKVEPVTASKDDEAPAPDDKAVRDDAHRDKEKSEKSDDRRERDERDDKTRDERDRYKDKESEVVCRVVEVSA